MIHHLSIPYYLMLCQTESIIEEVEDLLWQKCLLGDLNPIVLYIRLYCVLRSGSEDQTYGLAPSNCRLLVQSCPNGAELSQVEELERCVRMLACRLTILITPCFSRCEAVQSWIAEKLITQHTSHSTTAGVHLYTRIGENVNFYITKSDLCKHFILV